MSKESRCKLIEEIEAKRNSRVIAYVTSDRPNLSSQIAGDVVSIIHDHILALNIDRESKLDLFLYSRGGHSDIPWTLVSMFREYCHKGSFSVLIPYRAHSAATVISLGADEIVMTKKAELGPIDATMIGPYNPKEGNTNKRLPLSVEDVNSYFALLERTTGKSPQEKMEAFKQLTAKVNPLALGAVNRILEETRLVGLQLLDTRAKPFRKKENQNIIKKLSSEVYSHSHTINRTEAIKNLGLKHVINAESIEIDDNLWNLYVEYRDFFKFETPFQPQEYLIKNDLEEYAWENLPFACVESNERFDVYRKTIKVRKLRQIPPQLNINLNNLNFPPLNIGNLPPGTDQSLLNSIVSQAVQATVQQSLNAAIQNAIMNLVKLLPQKGFEHIFFDSGWKSE